MAVKSRNYQPIVINMAKTIIQLNLDRELSEEEIKKHQEILLALVSCGGLSGVKGGRTIIHFDGEGIFQGIELDYWPWRRRKSKL